MRLNRGNRDLRLGHVPRQSGFGYAQGASTLSVAEAQEAEGIVA